MPLLDPHHHSLPFALGLELHSSSSSSSNNLVHESPPLPEKDSSMYELNFLLAGQGQLQSSSRQTDGTTTALYAGDTVLMTLGTACCCAPQPHGPQQQQQTPPLLPYSLAKLVVYMPTSLLPGPFVNDGAVHADGLSRYIATAWFDGPEHGQLSKEAAETLLLGAKNTARRAVAAGATAPQLDGGLDAAAAAMASMDAPGVDVDAVASNRTINNVSSSVTSSSRSSSEDPSIASSSSTGTGSNELTRSGGWLASGIGSTLPSGADAGEGNGAEDYVTRRTLRELTTYVLPGQTNRMAVVFDPQTRPAVPFVFGVEIFERGHKTKPHVHNTAHEVFVILSGGHHPLRRVFSCLFTMSIVMMGCEVYLFGSVRVRGETGARAGDTCSHMHAVSFCTYTFHGLAVGHAVQARARASVMASASLWVRGQWCASGLARCTVLIMARGPACTASSSCSLTSHFRRW